MEFFRAQQAVGTTISTYFIESTAPYNVDDTASPEQAPAKADSHLKQIDSDLAVKQIAEALVKGTDPNRS
jgi:hypothetical protein